jgi:hypothetical protein
MHETTLPPKSYRKFDALLQEEGNADALCRIHDKKACYACKRNTELRMGIDEREDADEEQEGSLEGMHFMLNNEVIDVYGENHTIKLKE